MNINTEPLRKTMESLMLDAVDITRPTKKYTWDANAKRDVEEIDPVWSGAALINISQDAGQAAAGGEEREGSFVTVSIPIGAPQINPKDIVTITAIRPNGDQTLVGRVIRVKDVMVGTYSVSKRLSGIMYSEVPY